MNSLLIFQNLDLLSVGFAVAATVVLGFAVYFNNSKSITNKTFLWFSLVTGGWGIFNYISYQFDSPVITLWLLRLVLFFAVWQAFTMFLFCYVFPESTKSFPRIFKLVVIPWVTCLSIITLTPYIFVDAVRFLESNRVANPVINHFGIMIFGITNISLVVYGVIILFRKTISVTLNLRAPFLTVFIGLVITLGLIIVFNFFFPVFLDNVDLIPLGALFSLPFVLLASYSILKYKLFNVRAIWAGILVFLLAMASFSEVILARELALIIYRSSILILVLFFGVLLIRGIIREVEQREQLAELNKKLQLAYEEVDRLSKAKSEFISIASHQLRTPLTAIKGYISMLLEGTYGKIIDRARKPLENVYKSNERLIRLVNDLLSISRIEAGKIEFESELTQIEEIIDEVVFEMEINAQKKGLYLKWEKSETPLPKMNLDREKMRQVILNIVDNSIKYTQEGGIEIKCEVQNSTLKIMITDTGEGMTKEDLEKIFETFSRGTVGVTTYTEGAGLGLYIAKKFVEMHGGRIWAESEGKGKGSTFYIELPIK
jgi:signal transduction histidine kinase